jgi:cyclohexa-1,5-dienecarbonyl-CoA hydratase
VSTKPIPFNPVTVWLEQDGALLRVRLSRPKANIVDAAMIAALRAAFAEHRGRAGLLAAILDAEGPNFSFGASVEEHLADKCAGMLAALHGLVIEMLSFPAPIVVAVKGQCLGGGLEVAMGASQIFASPDAKLGQPEIKLGVFAPAASCLLPARVGQPAAEELLLSGRSVGAHEAHSLGLVQAVVEDPSAHAVAWFEKHLAGKSSAAVARAMAAARVGWLPDVKRRIEEVERLYLDDLMKTHDANEGLAAFLAKRAPAWGHR